MQHVNLSSCIFLLLEVRGKNKSIVTMPWIRGSDSVTCSLNQSPSTLAFSLSKDILIFSLTPLIHHVSSGQCITLTLFSSCSIQKIIFNFLHVQCIFRNNCIQGQDQVKSLNISLFLPLLGFITEQHRLFFRDFAGVIFPVPGLIYI